MNGPPINPSRAISVKFPASLFGFAQLMVATSEFAECSVLLALQNEQFFHRESRSTIFIMWCISLIWIAFILLLLLGIFCNRPFLIIIHILFSIVLMVFEALLLAALIIYDAFSLPAKILFIVLIFVGVSVVIEWRCYRTMKTYL